MSCQENTKTEDNLIMEIDERGRRRVRFTPVSAAETGEAMQQLVLSIYGCKG